MEEFTKADLKNRMVVENREGIRFVVFENFLIGRSRWSDLNNYNDDLTQKDFRSLDIVRVYSQIVCLRRLEDENERELLWERSEVKEVTMSEVEEKFGCKVKIVKE